jgi:hypothetical protein
VDATPLRRPSDAAPVTVLVLAHHDPGLIVRLARAVRARLPEAEVVTAYNAPLDDADLAELTAAGVRRVGSGERAKWGEWSTVERVLEGLDDIDDDRAVLLVSADSHPTPYLAAWTERFAASGVHAAIFRDDVADDPLVQAHLRYRWWLWHRSPRAVSGVAFRAANAISGRLGRPLRLRASPRVVAVGYRAQPMPSQFAKGDLWFAISPRGRARLREGLADPDLRATFEHCLIPDEFFLHTIALLHGWRVWRTKVMFTAWPYPGAPNPLQLGPSDLETVLASSAPFVRKVAEPAGDALARILDDLPDAALTPRAGDPLLTETASGGPV